MSKDSIYTIERASPAFSWPEREAVDEADVDAALGAYVPGGARVYAWLPMADGHTVDQTARVVMRAAIAAVDKRRAALTQQGETTPVSGDEGRRGFEREERYIVFKKSHLTGEQLARLERMTTGHPRGPAASSHDWPLPTVECVVIERDWPEYERVWRMLQERVEASNG